MTHKRASLLVILSGPSGVGKDTVIQRLRDRLPDIYYAVTATTRPPRSGETHGDSYYFLSQQEYDGMLDRGDLLAPAEVHGHWYGAPVDGIAAALANGRDVLLKIDVQGAMQVRRRFPQAVFIFIAPASMSALVNQLHSRETESPREFKRRVADAQFEMAQLPQYDYKVVNRHEAVEHAVEEVACIVTAERLRLHRQPIALSKD
ncbi:MAG: guanylate kinase [Chloroflexota bacterium]